MYILHINTILQPRIPVPIVIQISDCGFDNAIDDHVLMTVMCSIKAANIPAYTF